MIFCRISWSGRMTSLPLGLLHINLHPILVRCSGSSMGDLSKSCWWAFWAVMIASSSGLVGWCCAAWIAAAWVVWQVGQCFLCSWTVSGLIRNFSGEMIAMFWLSSFPWSTPGGCDRASASMLVLPGMCLISKSYSWRSACHRAVRLLRFFGDFQYCRLAWSVKIVNGSFVHPRYGCQWA
jgi:hypothetical protein